MTEPLVRPEYGQPWTIEDLARIPDDGFRYEIVDGSLLVSPMPAKPHWRVTHRLRRLLEAQAPGSLVVTGENPGINISRGRSYRIPDIAVIHAAAIDGTQLGFEPEDFALVVEVLTPDNAGDDLVMKRHQYGKAGIPWYWIVSPRLRTLTVLAHDGDGSYVEEVVVGPGQTLRTENPYPIVIDPADFLD